MSRFKKIIKIIILYKYTRKIFCLIQILYFSLKKNYYEPDNPPLFLVSTNRSGSSLLTSILRQHPSLHSLSPENLNTEIEIKNSHTMGFGEDIIWRFLDNYNNDVHHGINEGFLWGDPKYISDFYKDNFFFKKALQFEIYRTKTNKIPFVKHSFFTLRIKLIKKIFPNAKFIFNIRSYKDFIKSNYHKNSTDERFKNLFKNTDPDIGLHWYLINSICMFQLEKYFKNQYIIFFHEKLYDNNFDNQKLMDEITDFLKIPKYSFNFEKVNKKYKYFKDINFNYDKMDFAKEIGDYENKFYHQNRNI